MMIDEATFKKRFPGIWRAATEYGRQNALCDLSESRANEPVGAGPAAMLTTPEPTATRPLSSLQLAITACDGDNIAIRIVRDGDGFTATVDFGRHTPLDRVEGEV